jgi:hypothetical protein
MNYKLIIPIFAIALFSIGYITYTVTKPTSPFSAETADVQKLIDSGEAPLDSMKIDTESPEDVQLKNL